MEGDFGNGRRDPAGKTREATEAWEGALVSEEVGAKL